MAVLTKSNVVPTKNKLEETEVKKMLIQKHRASSQAIDNLKKLTRPNVRRKGSIWINS